MILQLAQNITLILSLLFVYSLLRSPVATLSPRTRKIVDGIVFGGFAVLSMLNAIPVAPGIQIDGRISIIAIATLFGGGVALLAMAYGLALSAPPASRAALAVLLLVFFADLPAARIRLSDTVRSHVRRPISPSSKRATDKPDRPRAT